MSLLVLLEKEKRCDLNNYYEQEESGTINSTGILTRPPLMTHPLHNGTTPVRRLYRKVSSLLRSRIILSQSLDSQDS